VHPNEKPKGLQLVQMLGKLSFWGFESALRIIRRDAGEELVLIGAKP
jgi:hypothetical protein